MNFLTEKSYGNSINLLGKEYIEKTEKIKEYILLTIQMVDNDDLRDEQVRWEYFKYEIRKFTIWGKKKKQLLRDVLWKGVLKNFAQFTGKHLYQGLSCEFCEISKNTFSYRKPLVAVSEEKRHNLSRKKLNISKVLLL